MNNKVFLRVGVFLFFFCFCIPAFSQVFNSVKVVRVIDGDTVDLLLNGKQTRIRIAEIDCPERGQPFSKRATEFTKAFTNGKIVNLKIRNKDRYGRFVGYLSVGNKDLSAELVKNGYAWVYRYFSDQPLLLKYEDRAKKNKVGLWAESNPIEPSKYRKFKK